MHYPTTRRADPPCRPPLRVCSQSRIARVYAASAPVVTTPKSATKGEYRRRPGSGALRRRRGFGGVAQRVTETAHGLDVLLAAPFRRLPAELVHKNAQLELGFVLIPIEVIEEHLFGQHRSLTHAQQFEERILLAGQPDWLTLDHDRAVIQVQQQFAGADRRLRQALRTTHDRADAGDQLAVLEWLCQEIVGAKAESLELVVQLAQPRQEQNRGFDLRLAQLLGDTVPVAIGEHQVEKDDVVGLQLSVADRVRAAMR